MSFISGLLSLFGVGSGTNVVKQVTDVVKDYRPGEVTKHEMNVEQTKVEDASQDSARKWEGYASDSDLFNKIVNGLNRLPRPLFALWAFGVLVGLFPIPAVLSTAPLIVLNIIWTVIGFYFGIRTVSQDLPALIKILRKT